jgi:hypothetical protein
MATEAQIAANRRNAESSTGPLSPEGKSQSSRNAITAGLYSAGDFVRPEEAPIHQLFCEDFRKSLRPEGAIEQTLAAEIIHAAWRLRRCSVLESSMEESGPDPMVDPINAPAQRTIDRARGEAQRQMLRATAELRRLQTERQLRVECLDPGFDSARLGGLASIKDLQSALAVTRRVNLADTEAQIIRATMLPATMRPTKRTQSAASQTPRSAPCPCNSGQKYKRCCGKGAPAVLRQALQSAA